MTKYRIIQTHDGREHIKPEVYYSLDTVKRERDLLDRSGKPHGIVHKVQELHGRHDKWHYITC